MVGLSQKKKEALMNEINSVLYYEAPINGMFTKQIADKLIRDKEFIKNLLLEMEKRGWVEKVKKNKRNYNYMSRRRWVLSDDVRRIFDNKSQ